MSIYDAIKVGPLIMQPGSIHGDHLYVELLTTGTNPPRIEDGALLVPVRLWERMQAGDTGLVEQPEADPDGKRVPAEARARIEAAAAGTDELYVRWWNRMYGPGPVKISDDQGFSIEDSGDGWKYCGWRGTVDAQPRGTVRSLAPDDAWKGIWPEAVIGE